MNQEVGKQIAKAAVIIMVATLLGRVIGLVREQAIAAQFGASFATDAYKVAYTLPYIFGVMVTGAFNAVFIPMFTELLQKDDKEQAWRLGSAVYNWVLVVFVVLTVLGELLAPWILHVMASGFHGAVYELTIELIRVLLPTLIFSALAGITAGMLNSLQHFLVPAISPSISSIVIISSLFVLAPSWGVHGLAIGTLLGFLCQFLIQLPVLWRFGFKYSLTLDVKNPTIRRMVKLLLPVLIGAGVGQISLIVDQRFASTLSEGSVAALNFANRLMQLPLGLFVAALVVPLFPALSAYAAKKDIEAIRRTTVRGINFLVLIMVPAAVGLMVLDQPIVRLLFERGAFDAQDTSITASALFFLASGLAGFAVRDLYTRVYYSLKDTTTPVVIAALAVLVNVGLNMIFVKHWGLWGLTLATAIATYLNVTLQGWFLRRKLGEYIGKEMVITWGKIIVAALVMAGVIKIYAWQIALVGTGLTTISLLLRLSGAVVVGALVYAIAIILLRIPDAKLLTQTIWRRVKKA